MNRTHTAPALMTATAKHCALETSNSSTRRDRCGVAWAGALLLRVAAGRRTPLVSTTGGFRAVR